MQFGYPKIPFPSSNCKKNDKKISKIFSRSAPLLRAKRAKVELTDMFNSFVPWIVAKGKFHICIWLENEPKIVAQSGKGAPESVAKKRNTHKIHNLVV